MSEKKKNYRTLRTQAKYTSVPIDFLQADVGLIIATGQEIKITDTVKIVYIYMRNRYCLTLDDTKSEGYYEGWESIAANLGKTLDIFKKGVNRPDKALESLGLLEIIKKKKSRANLKVVKDVIEIEGAVVFLNSKATNYKERKTTERAKYLEEFKSCPVEEPHQIPMANPTPPIINPYNNLYVDDWDGNDLPF